MTSGLFYIIMLSYLQRRCYVSSLSTTKIVRPENGWNINNTSTVLNRRLKSETSLSPTSLFWLGPLTGYYLVYMVITYSRVWINRVRLPILLVVS